MKFLILIIALAAISAASACAAREPFSEKKLNRALARQLGAQFEVSHSYSINGVKHSIRVDIETDQHVIEAGLDKRSSLDSIQQAIFAAEISGKIPKIIIFDTDGFEGPYEFRIKQAARALGISCQIIRAQPLIK